MSLRLCSHLRRGCAAAICLVAMGCAPIAPQTNFPRPDAPSASPNSATFRQGYRFEGLAKNGQSADVLVIVAMSGGGKRSAAFSYGVLKGMRDTKLLIGGREHTLLSEVSIISSVSGGSFTSAYYGLHRDGIFETYERDFLKRDIESYIYGTYLLPWNWAWMFSSAWGTNDRMAQVYDELMFRGATYADLQRKGLPLIVLNATDISYGVPFSVTQTSFDMICSDLARYQVARAVAASNGFPVIFTPITLTSYIDKCPKMRKALSTNLHRNGFTRGAILNRIRSNYLDPTKTRYVHLMDGGIVDNLALRGLLNTLIAMRHGSAERRQAQLRPLLGVRRILVILSDGQAINDGRRARNRTVSGLSQIFDAVSGSQIDEYNLETMLLAKREFEDFAGRLRKARCTKGRRYNGHPCNDVKTFLVRVSIADVRDPVRRKQLENIRTGLTIKSESVDALVNAGRTAILGSPTIKRFVDSLRSGSPALKRRTVSANGRDRAMRAAR